MKITAERARELLNYDPETGVFTWMDRPTECCASARKAHLTRVWNAKFAGSRAGANSNGYIAIRIGDTNYGAHRLAWLMMTGEWPPHEIDHIDMDRANNRFANLREATREQNACNRRVQSNSKTGSKGVFFYERINKFGAQIAKGKKAVWLGYFENKSDAEAAVAEAIKTHHGDFGRAA